jgi:hypothetical protein
MNLIGESLSNNIDEISGYEKYFEEYSQGKLNIYIDKELSESDIIQIENNILSQGAYLTSPIIQDSKCIIICFEKRIGPLLIIIAAIGAIGSGILGWQIFKAVSSGIPWWIFALAGVAAVALLAKSGTVRHVVTKGVL